MEREMRPEFREMLFTELARHEYEMLAAISACESASIDLIISANRMAAVRDGILMAERADSSEIMKASKRAELLLDECTTFLAARRSTPPEETSA